MMVADADAGKQVRLHVSLAEAETNGFITESRSEGGYRINVFITFYFN